MAASASAGAATPSDYEAVTPNAMCSFPSTPAESEISTGSWEMTTPMIQKVVIEVAKAVFQPPALSWALTCEREERV